MIADNTQKWVCHHRRETDENKSRSSLLAEGLYFGVPACELIFLTASDHVLLHKKGVPLSAEHKQHVSEAMKGVPLSDEHKQHLSEAMNRPDVKTRRSEALKAALNRPDVKKRQSEAMKGRKFWTNGIKTVRAKECPGEGFTPGRHGLKRLL